MLIGTLGYNYEDILKQDVYRDQLQHIFDIRAEGHLRSVQLCQYGDSGRVSSAFRVDDDGCDSYRLFWKQKGSLEEVILQFSGFLVSHNLPVWDRNTKLNNPAQCSQSVILSGFGVEQFQAGIKAVKDIQDLFRLHFGEGVLLDIRLPSIGSSLGLEFSTRYFSPIRKVRAEDIVSIPAHMDASRVLDRYVREDWRNLTFTGDNYVRYQEEVYVDDEEHSYMSYRDCGPDLFRLGQLVEVGVMFRVVRAGQKHRRLIISFHQLTLIGEGAARSLDKLSQQDGCGSNEKYVSVKRSISYEDYGDLKRARKEVQSISL